MFPLTIDLRIKATLAIVVAIWSAGLFFAFTALRPELAHTYGHLIRGFNREGALPIITEWVGLPVLGVPGSANRIPTLFPVVWFALFAAPLATLWSCLRAADRLSAMTRWVVEWSVYLAATAVIAMVVVFALWLPFAYLSS